MVAAIRLTQPWASIMAIYSRVSPARLRV